MANYMRKFWIFALGIVFVEILSMGGLCEENTAKQEALDIKGRSIFILGPLLVYENAYTEQRYGAVDESTKEILSTEMFSKAQEVLLYCGGKPSSIVSLPDSERSSIEQAYYKLQDSSEDLVKQWKDKSSFAKEFSLIKDTIKCDLILATFVKAKVGTSGSWDFVYTGNIVPGTSTTAVKAALIDAASGAIVWSGSFIERDMPQKYVLIKCLKNLYAKFPGYSKK